VRLVLDVNVLVAAFGSRGACADLFVHIAGRYPAAISEPMLDDLRRNLLRKFRLTAEEAAEIEEVVRKAVEIVRPADPPEALCRDPDDDHVLAAAFEFGADAIITGDKDLLVLHPCRGIAILRPRDFWAFEADWGRAKD
jgi:putative PIN family toxin of toxin-antitoxin system